MTASDRPTPGSRAPSGKYPQILEGHQQRGKRFLPPLMQFDNLRMVSWHHDMLPDFLWIALMLGRRSTWAQAYRPLTVVDRFVPDGRRVADGRLSSFGLVPERERAAARKAVQRETPHALPAEFGHALGLFPACPALWLYNDWLEHNEPDPAVGLPLLRTLVGDNADKGGVQSTRLRMAAISRLVTHGKFSHSGDSLMQLVPKYPGGLEDEDQRAVESVMRAMWGALFAADVTDNESALTWAQNFWQRSRELTHCEFRVSERTIPVNEDADGPLDPEPMLQVAELRTLLTAVRRLGDQLRESQLAALGQPGEDESTAVLFGMASRMYRLLVDLLDRPSSWSPSTSSYYLRPIVETRIVSAWLAKRNDPALFAAYREHGLGNLKLLRDHINADFSDETPEFLEHLDRRVNLEIDEWAQIVNVGAFTNVTVRQMAIECDLKRLYDLSFAPLSSENHGEWPSVRENDTTLCTEPLHGGHRVGSFEGSSRLIGPQAARSAITVVEEGITLVFGHYDIEISQSFGPVWDAFTTAMYVNEDNAVESGDG